MTVDISLPWLLTFALGGVFTVLWWLVKGTVKRIEKDYDTLREAMIAQEQRHSKEMKEIQKEMSEMKENYVERFDELKDLQTSGNNAIKDMLSEGAVRFATMQQDIEHIKTAMRNVSFRSQQQGATV